MFWGLELTTAVWIFDSLTKPSFTVYNRLLHHGAGIHKQV